MPTRLIFGYSLLALLILLLLAVAILAVRRRRADYAMRYQNRGR